jgi:hypothetical protein
MKGEKKRAQKKIADNRDKQTDTGIENRQAP